MAKKSEFVEYLLEILEPFAGVTAKSMFGGYGVFKEGLMFALVADDTLYFKVDDFNRFEFERLNLGPFIYMKGDKPMPMSYYKAPESALDNSEEMVRWALARYELANLRLPAELAVGFDSTKQKCIGASGYCNPDSDPPEVFVCRPDGCSVRKAFHQQQKFFFGRIEPPISGNNTKQFGIGTITEGSL